MHQLAPINTLQLEIKACWWRIPKYSFFSSTIFASSFKNEISLIWKTTKKQVVNQHVMIALKNYPNSMKKIIHILTTHLSPLTKGRKLLRISLPKCFFYVISLTEVFFLNSYTVQKTVILLLCRTQCWRSWKKEMKLDNQEMWKPVNVPLIETTAYNHWMSGTRGKIQRLYYSLWYSIY